MLIGALLIGHSPRPDLVDPLQAAYPAAEIIEAGALDPLPEHDLPDAAGAAFPLVTRLRSGRPVAMPQAFLEPLLQAALDRLEAAGVDISILLCAGTFAALQGKKPLVKPFDAARHHLVSQGLKRLGLIVPVPEQERPIATRWQVAGFEPLVWTADLARQDAHFATMLRARIESAGLQALVLDFVGHPAGQVAALARLAPVPVYDLGQLAIKKIGSVLTPGTG